MSEEGRYADDSNVLGQCNPCPAGFYCLAATQNPIPCPAGYYCEEGDATNAIAPNNFPQPCAKGTYGHITGLKASDECKPCDEGFYCSETGADSPTGMCDAGYYCTGGSTSPRQTICQAGGYCEQGSAWPKFCQGGYYNPEEGKKTIYDCVQCEPGMWCAGEALTAPNDHCDDGYFCLAASSVKEQWPALPGSYSNSENLWKLPLMTCQQGYYQDKWHQASCTLCPEGFFCRAEGITNTYTDCEMGYYCPEGSIDPIICLQGTYNPTPNAWLPTHCLDCPPGHYCGSQGLAEPSGECSAGYFCSVRSID